jgi:hypothetical protein
MAKQSEYTRALAKLDAQIATLQAVKQALTQAHDEMPKRTRKVRVTVKPPKPGELRDRAILGGEPSL